MTAAGISEKIEERIGLQVSINTQPRAESELDYSASRIRGFQIAHTVEIFYKPGPCRYPPELLPRPGARRRQIHAYVSADTTKPRLCLFR